VVAMMGRPPNHAFLGVRRREKGFHKLHASEIFFFVGRLSNKPLKPPRHLVLEGAVREVAVPESRDEKHPPVTIQQADNQHGRAAKEPVSIPETGQELIEHPPETDDAEQINNEKAALVDDILDANLFPDFQFVFFRTYHGIECSLQIEIIQQRRR
jgi:hypothetical protein